MLASKSQIVSVRGSWKEGLRGNVSGKESKGRRRHATGAGEILIVKKILRKLKTRKK